MTNRIVLIAALATTVFAGSPVAADFQTVSRAYEVALSDFRMAATHNGAVIFRRCADCEATAVRVTPKTLYQLNGQPVTLREFRKSIFQVRDRAAGTIIVLHHLESDTVESVTFDE